MRNLIFLLLIFLVSCKSKSNNEAFTFKRSDFENILFEIHKLEGNFDFNGIKSDSISQYYFSKYDSIFESNNTTKMAFLEEYNRYIEYNPADLDSIYGDLIDKSTHIKDSIKKREKSADRLAQPNPNKVIKKPTKVIPNTKVDSSNKPKLQKQQAND